MSWYRTGTIGVTNGSAAVTGSGTAWVGTVQSGWGLVAPDGRLYEVASVNGAGSLTLAVPYLGSGQSGQAYALFPTQGLTGDLVASLNALIATVQATIDGAGQGKFADGSPAAPGLRFAADENTGIRRSASDTLALVAGGIDRATLAAAGLTLNVPLLGTAAQANTTDATPGRLMKNAAFGWGANDATLEVPAGGFDALRITGFWRSIGSETGAPPFSAAIVQHMVRIGGDASDGRHIQVAYDATSPQMAIRTMLAGGTWTAWKLALQTAGNNANGDYIRFPDGTQYCWHGVSATSGSDATWTYPAAFTGPTPDIFGLGTTPDRIVTVGSSVSLTAATIRAWLLSSAPVRSTTLVSVLAIGKWY